ncbi:hypothetical protein LTS12_026610 [Elasticomyces elasticus]|nr:hypothetical protein LTS12_026610 [Elasticomyces elasticus]
MMKPRDSYTDADGRERWDRTQRIFYAMFGDLIDPTKGLAPTHSVAELPNGSTINQVLLLIDYIAIKRGLASLVEISRIQQSLSRLLHNRTRLKLVE